MALWRWEGIKKKISKRVPWRDNSKKGWELTALKEQTFWLVLELYSVAVTEIQHSTQMRVYFSHRRRPGGDRGLETCTRWLGSAAGRHQRIPRESLGPKDRAHVLTGGRGGELSGTERQASQLRQVPSKSFTHPSLENFPYTPGPTSNFKERWTWKSDLSKNGQKQNQEVKKKGRPNNGRTTSCVYCLRISLKLLLS